MKLILFALAMLFPILVRAAWPMSSESATPGQADICEDLYGAACISAEGKQKYEGHFKKAREELSRPITEARDKAAAALGFKNFEDALADRLKKSNISPSTCPAEIKNVTAADLSKITDGAALRETEKIFNHLEAKYQDAKVALYAKDMSYFMYWAVTERCRGFEGVKQAGNAAEVSALNPELATSCRNTLPLERAAVELYRHEDDLDYSVRAEKFVRAHLLPALKKAPGSGGAGTSASAQAAAERARQECGALSTLVRDATEKTRRTLLGELNISKVNIDSILNSYYGAHRKKFAMEIFDSIRSDAQGIVSQFVKDPAKKSRIVDEYDKMELFWMDPPPASFYKRDKSGQSVLDETKDPGRGLSEYASDAFWIFMNDSNLSYFTMSDANYFPHLGFGKTRTPEWVIVKPEILNNLETNSFAFLQVVAHEVGHKIAPQMSRANGHELTPQYKELVDCLKSEKSIRMAQNQIEEAIADSIGAEIMAQQIARMPSDKRRQALLSSMQNLCALGENTGQGSLSLMMKTSHTEDSLRTNGIYGANPRIREAIGCAVESSQYKSCGLKISLMPKEAALSGHPTKKTSNKKVQR